MRYKMLEPLMFETSNRNKYIFDNSTCIILPLGKDLSKDKDLGRLKGSQDNLYYVKNEYIKEAEEKYDLFKERTLPSDHKLNLLKMINEIKYYGISQMILIMTEECNFRCRYCIYSGQYYYNRVHSHKYMTFETAKKALDYFFKYNYECLKTNPLHNPVIGFYGGEPLLNWDVIVKIVNYIQKHYKNYFGNIIFTITTNGYLLNKSKIDFMLKNNFAISISLDGPKSEHDRNRITINKEPTFDKVIYNLTELHNLYNSYSHNGQNPIPYNILVTYDDNSDLAEMEHFFNEQPFGDRVARISKVNEINTDYYYENRRNESLQNQYERLFNKYKQSAKEGNSSKFLKILYNQFFLSFYGNKHYAFNYLKSACIPGSKIAVDPDGIFHMCERISNNYPIGDIHNGLNPNKQKQYLDSLIHQINTNCNECNISNICKMCYTTCEAEGGTFRINSEICCKMRHHVKESLSLIYTILEDNPNFLSGNDMYR